MKTFSPETILQLRTLPTLTIPQACAVAQVTRRTIYNWINDGKVQVERTASGMPRIVTATLWKRKRAES